LAATPTVSRDSRAAHWCEHCHHTPCCAPWDVVHTHSGTHNKSLLSPAPTIPFSPRRSPLPSLVALGPAACPATPLHPSPPLYTLTQQRHSIAMPLVRPLLFPFPIQRCLTVPTLHLAPVVHDPRHLAPLPGPSPDQSNPTEHLPLLALADVLRGWVGGGVWCRVYDCEVPLAKARYHWSRPLRSLSCVRWWRPTRVWRRTGSSSPPASRPCRCRCALSARSLALHLTARCVLGAGNAHKATTRPCTHASSSTEGAQRHSTYS
jgi:hypothetical protein